MICYDQFSLHKMSGEKIFFLFISFIAGCAGSSLLPEAFSSCGWWGPLLTGVHGLLTAGSSLVLLEDGAHLPG